ncbi:nuclear transport factor 2 family protein [Lysobacter firmicutimachus]|uniref:Nuclear transport factor 2 family protein n=1 Tax=Lysobacter firmicutimachus TaxID=1792846 RepID=A0AAU8MRK2_9GAMM
MTSGTALRLTALSLALAPLTGLAQTAAVETAQHRHCLRDLERVSEATGRAFEQRDLDAFMASFADDAIQVNTRGQLFQGKPAIAAFYRAVMAGNYTFKRTLLSQQVNGCSSAIVADRIEFALPEAGIVLHGIDVANWVRKHGRWQLAADTTTQIAQP